MHISYAPLCPYLTTVFPVIASLRQKFPVNSSPTRATASVPAQPQAITPLLSLGLGDGVNLQPSYYNSGNVNFGWSLMKANTKIKTVRIEIEPTVSITTVKSWISQARSNGFAVIATYHKASVLGSDNVSDLLAAANWWKANYSSLASAGSFTVNLMNEWGDHNLTASAYASAYNQAIPIVRTVYSGTIIIDCSGWGQETHVATQAILGTAGTKISDGGIIPSVHVYPNGWNQALNHNLQKLRPGRPGQRRQRRDHRRIRQFPFGQRQLVRRSYLCEVLQGLDSPGLGLERGRGEHEYGNAQHGLPTRRRRAYAPAGYFNTIYSLL